MNAAANRRGVSPVATLSSISRLFVTISRVSSSQIRYSTFGHPWFLAVTMSTASEKASEASKRRIPPTIVAPSQDMKTITEGSATVLYNSSSEVFYNPVQILNRDLSVTVLRVWDRLRRQCATEKDIKRAWARRWKRDSDSRPHIPPEELNSYKDLPGLEILEALSASGLRSVRYAKEVPNIDSIMVNDLDKAAYDCIQRNVEFNGLDTEKIKPSIADANDVMFEHRHPQKQFDVVDLDPYGTASPFIDTGVQAVKHNGLLCVTCTDMPTLAGSNMDATFSIYGCVLPKGKYCHELALRSVLGTIEMAAARHKRTIIPLVSISVDFYIRLFVVVKDSAASALQSGLRFGHLWQCSACDSFAIQGVARLQPKGQRKRSRDQDGTKEEGGSSVNKTHVAGNGDHVEPKYGRAYTNMYCNTTPGDRPDGKVVPARGLPTELISINSENEAECSQCSGSLQKGGPIWAAPIHDSEFVRAVLMELESGETAKRAQPQLAASCVGHNHGQLKVSERIFHKQDQDAGSNDIETVETSRNRLTGIIRAIAMEAADIPLYYDVATLSGRIHCNSIPGKRLQNALINMGYRVSGTHAKSTALKTDAPPQVLWDIFREHEKEHPISEKHRSNPQSVAYGILSKPIRCDISFTEPSKEARDSARRLWDIPDKWTSPLVTEDSGIPSYRSFLESSHGKARYIDNPGCDWGPKSKAIGYAIENAKDA